MVRQRICLLKSSVQCSRLEVRVTLISFELREIWMPTSLGLSPDASTNGVTSDKPLHFSEPQFLPL